MTITTEMIAWGRVVSYLLVAAMVATTATYTPRLRWALYLTAVSFMITAFAAFVVSCGQPTLRDEILNVQTPFIALVALQWMRVVWKITRQ